jgi:hypothetical protein
MIIVEINNKILNNPCSISYFPNSSTTSSKSHPSQIPAKSNKIMRRVRKISNSISSLPKSFHPLIYPSEKPSILRSRRLQDSISASALPKTSSSHLKEEKKPAGALPVPKFLPKNRYYVQLSPGKNDFDLKGKSIEQDRRSVEKILNYEKIVQKASDLKMQLRSFNLKSARFSLMKRIELLKTPSEKDFILKTDNFFKEIKSGNIEKVQEMLQEDSSLVHLYDSTKQSALHWACRRDYVEIVKLLLKHGATWSTLDMMGRSAEDIARSKKFYEILEIFASLKRITRHNSMKNL